MGQLATPADIIANHSNSSMFNFQFHLRRDTNKLELKLQSQGKNVVISLYSLTSLLGS